MLNNENTPNYETMAQTRKRLLRIIADKHDIYVDSDCSSWSFANIISERLFVDFNKEFLYNYDNDSLEYLDELILKLRKVKKIDKLPN